MLSRPRVAAALEAKRDAFAAFDLRAGQELDRYRQAMDWLQGQSAEGLRARLATIDRPGALPTCERIAGERVLRRFAPASSPGWQNHEQAREWAIEVLRDVPTVAVDGSQITPTRDFSIPVGAVQVGWFENCHNAAGDYTKDIQFEALAPSDLADSHDSSAFPDQRVNLRRYELECEVLVQHMRRWAGREPRPLCFFDGSLVISFAAQLGPELQYGYLRATRSLLETSEETGVPLVGYVDTSYATDLVSMLRYLIGDAESPEISDAALLTEAMGWGDRSEAWICARNDRVFERVDPALDYYHRVHLVYLKTTAANPPVRLDVPAWLLEAGLLDSVLDLVRAECIVGIGYPYAVETADAVAVITMEDRERFYRMYQEFLERLNVPLRYSRKAYSKRGRR